MDSTQLAQIRRDFYFNIRRRVESILGQESKSLKNYRESYERELSKSNWQNVDKKHFFSRMQQAEVVLVGDFHAQKQSTRGFLRIIRKIKTDFVLALECLRVCDQVHLDAYIQGELSEKEFLSKVAWKKNWGFPWENYKALLKWAQLNKIKVYGINTDKPNETLLLRDQFSAQKIKEIIAKNKGKKVFVQYGDLHLASAHLPKQLKKQMPKLNLCVVYQSPEELYFKIMLQQKELSTDVVKLNSDTWALNVVPPWVKWQDYLLHLESGQDRRVKSSDMDPTDTVAQTVNFLAQSFGLSTDLSKLSIYSSDDDNFFNAIESCSLILKKKIIENVQEGVSFYVPELQCGYLARYSVNHVTRVASQFIYCNELMFTKTILDSKKEFHKLVWLEAVIYFFGKVKNPKKKTDTLQDIRSAIQKEQFDDRGKEALQLSLTQKMVELQFLSGAKLKGSQDEIFSKYNKKSFSAAAQIIGGITGEKMFYAFSKKLIKLPQNKKLIFKNLSLPNFQRAYFESLELIESWPVSFKSKYDKL